MSSMLVPIRSVSWLLYSHRFDQAPDGQMDSSIAVRLNRPADWPFGAFAKCMRPSVRPCLGTHITFPHHLASATGRPSMRVAMQAFCRPSFYGNQQQESASTSIC